MMQMNSIRHANVKKSKTKNTLVWLCPPTHTHTHTHTQADVTEVCKQGLTLTPAKCG